uniref:Ubiquitin-like protease family profile domain-containing protein n=1 Tax=Chenopodium quinoa TaxID=63459 RepID=A0A803MS21_CHEQI
MTLEQSRDFPVIKVWTTDLIKDRIDLELRLGFGLGTLLDRVQPPIVVDIPIPQHLLGENQVLVVVPDQPEIKQKQEEEQQQKNWFGNMIDDVVKNVMMVSIQDNPSTTKVNEPNMEEDEDVLEKEDVGEEEIANVEEAVGKKGQKRKEKMEEKSELLYDDVHSFLTRKLVKTLGDNVYIYNDIIDAWSLVLNARNAIDDKKRVFFSNEAFRDAFAMYLNKYEIKIGEKMPTYIVKLVEMPWRTLNNNVDCSIYTMRHMKTYFGKRRWNCGLRVDN